MEYTRLGATGLEVSRICLGCMSFGVPDRGAHTWTLDEDASRPVLQRALELGVNFLDTANVYSDGTSEEIVGRALRDLTRREDVVLATKVHGRMRPGPNGGGLSRKAIMTEIDASLRRLGTDHVDLYQIHRWDPDTPVEETMEALHDVVKAGKARYLGASSMWAWQFAKAQSTAERRGWTPSRAQVALAWLLAKPVVTAPIVGATKLSHVEDAVAAVDVRLDEDVIARLEEPYAPHAVAGF